MFRFAIKNMAIKKAQVILVLISIVLSAGVGLLAYNIAEQVEDGITGNAGYYGAIIGPSGSQTQLAMNTMYFSDEPLGTIPYSIVDDLKKDMRVTEAIPFAMADSYNGFSVVGTTPSYLNGKNIREGEMYEAAFEVVLGATVAKVNQVKVGDSIYTSHSAGETHKTPLRVVGILEESHSVYDNVVFTAVETLWEIHEEEEEEEEAHDHEELHGSVCAILVKTKNLGYAMQIVDEYNGKVILGEEKNISLLAIEPMATVRNILEETDNTKYIVFVLCAIILLMNILVISIITLLNLYHSTKEIALMRLIGISMKKINLLYIIQNGLIGLVSSVLAFGVSRLCLLFAGDYVASMGVVLNAGKVYPLEFGILIAVFCISVLPTVICTARMSRRDGLN